MILIINPPTLRKHTFKNSFTYLLSQKSKACTEQVMSWIMKRDYGDVEPSIQRGYYLHFSIKIHHFGYIFISKHRGPKRTHSWSKTAGGETLLYKYYTQFRCFLMVQRAFVCLGALFIFILT